MNVALYISACCGVATSILLPVLIRSIRDEFEGATPSAKKSSFLRRINRVIYVAWPYLRKYLKLLTFSLLTALLIMAIAGDKIKSLEVAFLAGYAWDSTIQKFVQKWKN